jgi:hypothetical protein
MTLWSGAAHTRVQAEECVGDLLTESAVTAFIGRAVDCLMALLINGVVASTLIGRAFPKLRLRFW